MKNYLTQKKIRFLPYLCCLFWLLAFNSLNAQNISLTWDIESGCQIYKPGERKDFQEDIGTGACVRVCEFSAVKYTINNSNSSWPAVWTVTGGTITSQNNSYCTVNWGASGWGLVSVTVTTPNGPRTDQVCIEIIDGPEAQFTIFPENPGVKDFKACLEQELYFTNLSTDGGGTEIVSYFWDFGDDQFSSEFEPSHAYTQPNTYKVILTVTNACNCTSRIVKYIHVSDMVSFPITCNSVVCEGGSDDYTIPDYIAQQCNEFNWKVEGGTITSHPPYGPSINVVWDNVDSTGFGYVTFDGSACHLDCSAVTIKVPVVQAVGTIVGDAVVCAYSQYRYKLPQWPTTDFVWSVVDPGGTGATFINTDQRNEVIVQTGSAGDITLRCTYQNTMLKCGGSAEFNIHIRDMGVVSGPKAICQYTSATYTMNNGYIANWTLRRPNNTTATGTGNSFTSTFNIPGNYTLTVTGNNFCQPAQPYIIRVDEIPPMPDPVDIIGPDKVCMSTPVEYSLVNTEPGTVLAWQAINGTISGSNYGEHVTVQFNPGFASYGIQVWRENTKDPHCASPIATKTVLEHVVVLNIDPPVNDICPSSVSGPYIVNYTEGETYEWTVTPSDAGSVSAGQGTNSVYVQWNSTPIAGTSVNVKVRKCNTYYNSSIPVTVTATPTLSIINVASSICPDVYVTPYLGATPSLISGTIVWDFGDGSPTETVPLGGVPDPHQYGNPSANTNYTITATVLNPNGCISPISVSQTFTVKPAPVAFISPDTNRVFCGTVTPFTLTATINVGFGTTIKWYKGGALIPGATGITYNVTDFGSYSAYVANSNGCGNWTNTVYVTDSCGPGCSIVPPPSVSLNLSQTACTDVLATVSASPTPASYSWSIGTEGGFVGSPTGTTGNIQYSKAGLHTVIYYATYNTPSGPCTKQVYETIIIPFIPKVKYSVACNASTGTYDITVYDYSQYYPAAPADTKTFYINGTPYPVPVGQSSYTVYGVPGGNYTFGVELTEAGYQTCDYYISEYLPLIQPVVIPAVANVCDGTGFTFSSNIPASPGLYYIWDFGDGTLNNNPTPTKIYSLPGTYTVTLTVYTLGGCSVQDTQIVTVNPNTLDGNLTSTSPNCEGDPIIITFNNTGTAPAPSSYTWMKDTSVVGTTTTPNFSVNESGAYWVTLANSNGCIKYIETTNAAFIMTPDPVIEGPDGVCVGTPFELSGYAGGGSLEYRWLRNGAQIAGWSSSSLLNYTATTAGAATYKVEVRVSDGSGGYCISSATYVVTAYTNPPIPFATFVVDNCYPYTVKLMANAGTPGTYNWSNGEPGQNITVNAGGPYMVTFTNPGGCTSTYQLDVPKDPEVYLWIFPSGCYDFCFKEGEQNGPFDILGPAQTVSFNRWKWIKDGNIDQIGGGVVPNYTISQSGTYEMSLDNGYCEKTSDKMEVNITDCKCSVRFGIKSIKVDTKPFCHYIIDMFIDNPYGSPINVNVNAGIGTGVFQPGSVTVPPGGGNFSFTFVPINFSGGSLEITMTTTNEKGDLCRTINKFDFPQCGQMQSREGTNGDLDANGIAKMMNSLVVSPNPTTDATGLSYTFANEFSHSRTIEIYSLMGILLEKHTPEDQQGIWQVDMSKYASGQYIAVMREDGVAIAQKAIMVK